MFHKQYYRLEEAAQKLGVDIEAIIQNYRDLSICVNIKNRVFFRNINDVMNEIKELVKNVGDAVLDKRLEVEGGLNSVIANGKINEFFSNDLEDEVYNALMNVPIIETQKTHESLETLGNTLSGYYRVLGFDAVEDDFFIKIVSKTTDFLNFEDCESLILEGNDGYYASLNDLVITHTELNRLLALKAEHDGKPTAEQLQQQLDQANARITELEALQAQPEPHNQPNESQQLYPCLQPIADIIEAFEHNPDFVKYGQGIKQQTIEEWLKTEYKTPVHEARHIKALITAHYNITT